MNSAFLIHKLFIPELIIIGIILGVVFLESFINYKYKNYIYIFVLSGLLMSIYLICLNFNNINNYIIAKSSNFIKNGFRLNSEGNLLKLILTSLIFMHFVYVKSYLFNYYKIYSEYFILILLALCGSMMLVSSNNFLNFYLGMEITLIPLYALMILAGKHHSIYFKGLMLNFIFSGIFLYGASLIYGASGTAEFTEIVDFIQNQHITLLFNAGLILIIIAILFKLYLTPFNPVVIATCLNCPGIIMAPLVILPCIGLCGAYINLFTTILSKYFQVHWQVLFVFIGIGSICWGSRGVVTQTNLKKIIGAITMTQSGLMLLGLSCNTPNGIMAAAVTIISYGLILINLWGIIFFLHTKGGAIIATTDFTGLYYKHPIITIILSILWLALTGFPPTIGFYAKISIFKALIASKFIVSAILVGLLSLISLYHGFKIINSMFLKVPSLATENLNHQFECSLSCSTGLIHLKDIVNYPGLILLFFNSAFILLWQIFWIIYKT